MEVDRINIAKAILRKIQLCNLNYNVC